MVNDASTLCEYKAIADAKLSTHLTPHVRLYDSISTGLGGNVLAEMDTR